MALRTILTDNDPALHKVCRPVTNFDGRLHDLIDDLKETLANANGAGLAAPQVGILRRVVIVVDDQENMLELVNPELIAQEGEQEGFEGCLSVPGRWGIVKRPQKAKVRAQDRNGNFFEAEGEDIVARCFCHELEHLDGHLFTEHTDRLYTNEELDEMIQAQEEDGE
ncbi:peptide deformylase [Intestinimonas massiliensis (ex Afouda et al. 2020)]|uniref:peptide deformylase n=1 Tax=Intestinimonas massiliensis (ex Afouda et al. 2020) TaxID=1673721 RepID=UPI00102F8E6B|nr:peptide deformylase [Intestinimonas massiliensis (ex Afouda et al. 2020)]